MGRVKSKYLINLPDTNENSTEQEKPQLISRSPYYDIDKFNLLANKNRENFSILSSDVQCINAKLDELELKI